ncbi:HECT-domain-containing protein [Phlyctema vagabunda]|uniref:HECT-type E3 ubiquitin transferase n=1 Tax=Phlyctema vagabunda TaxID=108571 RepID=A0ABR4P398_9HELO
MPQWSSRLLSANSRSELGAAPDAQPVSPSRARGPSMITESDIIESAYGIPTLHTQNSRRTQPDSSHGRSMSHPFPSLFPGKKKHSGDSPTRAPTGFESTDDDSTYASNSVPKSSSNNHKHTKVSDKDLKTGKCMTCDSTVRWPKELKLFRCTICLTVNDIQSRASERKRGDGPRVLGPFRAGTFPGSPGTSRASPISLEKTRKLIDQCITDYIVERLRHDDAPMPHPVHLSPPLRTETQREPGGLGNIAPPKVDDPQYTRALPPHVSNEETGNKRQPTGSPGGESAFLRASPYSTSSPGNLFGNHMRNYAQTHNAVPLPSTNNYRDQSSGKPAHSSLLDKAQTNAPVVSKSNHGVSLFKPLEEYIIVSVGSIDCINGSFSSVRPGIPRTGSEGTRRKLVSNEPETQAEVPFSEMDAKTLLIGDFAENGSWWTGDRPDPKGSENHHAAPEISEVGREKLTVVTLKSPRIDWVAVNEWYHLVVYPGRSWRKRLDELLASEQYSHQAQRLSGYGLAGLEESVMEAQSHCQRVLLKATENLLKRPGQPLKDPGDLRFLLILLANPLLYPSSGSRSEGRSRSRSRSQDRRYPSNSGGHEKHSGIIKRILGLMSNAPNECHHHLVGWFARFSDGQFQRMTDLIGSFVTYRLSRQHGKKREQSVDPTSGLIPSLSGPGRNTSAALHAALGANGQATKKTEKKSQPVLYNDDWQVKAAARVMALFFSANNSGTARKVDTRPLRAFEAGHSAGLAAREKARSHGQILATSDFYNTLLDYSDLIADFEAWESGRGKFSFCQYPFFLSIWAKIQIMEHDARRQMEVKAREAFFDSIMTRKTVNQYLVLHIRRDCLVEDSLKGVSEVVGTGGEEIKKGLRIDFKGEEGIDAGGLRKEWFLLLVRDVFNPEHGMFKYDDDSHFCYFNPNSFETTDQFFLVGVVLGLAIYNSTILDVAFPPFVFRKLLAAAPAAAPGATSHAKPQMTYSLEDLAELQPALAQGLRQLLDFDGDVETTFCRDFVADIDRYGQTSQVPLCQGGESKPVTNTNRREFVDLYVRYLLDTAVTRQFEPFKRGFFTVCGGNALSLFRPEEIELLIRGSDEPLDIASLRAVAVYDNWGVANAPDSEPVVSWFWDSFEHAEPKDQRKLLSFITGSDRIPATGTSTMVIKLSCLGDDGPRFPVARTCFNMISLWRYSSKPKLEDRLWRAVHMSEGFGLK